MTPGGNHVGEILGKGRFAVLAPSIGPTGNDYEAYHRCAPEDIPVIDTLEQLTLVAVKASRGRPKKTTVTPLSDPSTPTTPASTQDVNTSALKTVTPTATSILDKYPQLKDKVFDLRDLGTDTTRNVLAGLDTKGDRSHSLTTAIRDWYGWENWCNLNGIAYRGDTHSLALEAGINLKLEDVEARVDRILAGIDGTSCLTSCEYKGSSDDGCWKRIFKLAGVKVKKPKLTYNVQPSSLNAKVIPLPTATPLPKAVGGNDNSPPKPPNYGGGRGGSKPSSTPNDWGAPEIHNGELGYWRSVKGEDEPIFEPKCDFDIEIVKVFIRPKAKSGMPITGDGGGVKIKVTYAQDGTSDFVYVTSLAFGKADKFVEALKAGLGRSVTFKLRTDQLQSLKRVREAEYFARGGKLYKLCDRIGQQEDQTWVLAEIQYDAVGNVLAPEETLWEFNPQIGVEDGIPTPPIPPENDPNVIRELLLAQREFAGANFERFALVTGYNAACLHEQEIMRQERRFPGLNPNGDVGSGKTIAAESAHSPMWGDTGLGVVASTSISMAWERLSKLGSIPSMLDDPPSKSKKDKEALDEFLKAQFNKYARQVRKNTQQPHSSIPVTSNFRVGDNSHAVTTRIIDLFFPNVKLNRKAYPRLREAMRRAPLGFRSLLHIGYNKLEVEAVRDRLSDYLPNAHERAADNWALMVWYTDKVLKLAGMEEINIEAWVIEHICPTLNEDQKGLNSGTDFIKRLLALHTQNQAGTWNTKIVAHRAHGECLALEMRTLWEAIERSSNLPTYNQKVLENVLLSKGCVRGVSTKFYATREGVLNYLRELGKGANQGENWMPPAPPPQACKRALLIPKRLWDEFGFDPDDLAPMPTPPTPPSDDNGEWDAWGEGDVPVSSYTPVAPSFSQLQPSVTSSNLDVESVLDAPLNPSYEVTKKIEERERVEELVEKANAQEKNDGTPNVSSEKLSEDASEKLVTSVTGKNRTSETSAPQSLEVVTEEMKLDETDAPKNVTLAKTEGEAVQITPNVIDLPLALELAAKLDQCDTWAQIQELCVGVSAELYKEALTYLEDGGDRVRRLQADAAVVTSKPTSDATISKDAVATAVGKLFRYVGVLTHQLKDAEANPILDAAGKALTLTKGSELLLEDIGGVVNPDYVNVRPLGVECRPLGLRRSQLEEI
jgi:hypothetical protein